MIKATKNQNLKGTKQKRSVSVDKSLVLFKKIDFHGWYERYRNTHIGTLVSFFLKIIPPLVPA
jgi:hypothetical protein